MIDKIIVHQNLILVVGKKNYKYQNIFKIKNQLINQVTLILAEIKF